MEKLNLIRLVDHPRIRGEHRSSSLVNDSKSGSSPHTRGAREEDRSVVKEGRIIPAYAGSTPLLSPSGPGGTDHPRIRGEHRSRPGRRPTLPGSSPHTRGARRGSSTRGAGWRIIPAYAGSTDAIQMLRTYVGDHPRIRGEHIQKQSADSTGKGSSPHTRGAPRSTANVSITVRIIPAYAGSTTDELQTAKVTSGSSPHTRGAHPKTERGLHR